MGSIRNPHLILVPNEDIWHVRDVLNEKGFYGRKKERDGRDSASFCKDIRGRMQKP